MPHRTNPLPAGTRNTSLNLIDEEYQHWLEIGGISEIKKYALLGLKAAGHAKASVIEAVRNERLRLKHGITALLIMALTLAMFSGEPLKRQLRARAKRREDVASFEDSWTSDPHDDIGPVTWASITEAA